MSKSRDVASLWTTALQPVISCCPKPIGSAIQILTYILTTKLTQPTSFSPCFLHDVAHPRESPTELHQIPENESPISKKKTSVTSPRKVFHNQWFHRKKLWTSFSIIIQPPKDMGHYGTIYTLRCFFWQRNRSISTNQRCWLHAIHQTRPNQSKPDQTRHPKNRAALWFLRPIPCTSVVKLYILHYFAMIRSIIYSSYSTL